VILLMTTPPPENSPWGVPAKVPPFGLAYVAGALEKAGFTVEVLDNYQLQNTVDKVKLEIEKRDPEIVGISCSSVTYQKCVETAKVVKAVNPSCRVVVGGWHPSFVPESMLQHPEIDYVVMGEGEYAMVELATSITKGFDDSVAAKVPGVASMHNGKLIKNPPKIINDLDQIPYPAWHLFPMDIYDRKIDYLNVRPVDVVNATRGCPYNCNYCENRRLWGAKCRSFSPLRLVDEIEYMTKDFGSKGIYFIGDNFTINKRHTLEFCRLMKERKLNIEWVCDTRVDLISPDLLREMKSAGCKTIFFGIQSGSPPILKRLNINLTIDKVIQGFKLCRDEGIQISCSFMLGIPGETVKDMETTYKFAKKLDPDWCTFYVFIGCPDNSLYQEILQKGLYDRKDGFLAFAKTEEFNYESVVKIQQRFQKGFNLSRKRILRKIQREGLLSVVNQSLRKTSHR
jgi:anaerobic magnesium-protoporphyrin IX monomethyl ester cyclase